MKALITNAAMTLLKDQNQNRNNPAIGVMHHADAGHDDALACAPEQGLNLPGILNEARGC